MSKNLTRRGLLAAAALPLPAIAQVPDGGVIRIIVPFAPGGAGDLVARLVAERLDPLLDRRIIVENRGGAGGNIGARAVAAAHAHRDVIRQFGRFPHRNAILGRTSTPEEAAYLARPGAGF